VLFKLLARTKSTKPESPRRKDTLNYLAANLRVQMIVIVGFVSTFLLQSQVTQAQYGFTPNTYMTPGYASEWGNVYSGAVMQLPQWNNSVIVGQPITTGWQTFQLGAYIQNVPNGVVIRQVVPGGLAAINGLKDGDTVISAGGSQVGYVYGRTVDLVTEMSRRADVYGRVNLVVFDAITRQMRSYDFAIRPQTAVGSSIIGQIVLDGNIFLSNYGTLKVELQNVTRPYIQIAGGVDNKQVYGRGPYPFAVRFDPRFIYPTDRYRLVATLYDGFQQVLGSAAQDIASPVAGVQTTYNLRLQSVPSYGLGGGSVVGYYPPDMNTFYALFRQYIGREPTISESQAWASQLASGTVSSSEVKAELLASPAFYDRAGNVPDLFVQRMIETVSGQPARFDQIQYWRARLDSYGGMRLAVAREYLRTISP
jgi:hypothetical protein